MKTARLRKLALKRRPAARPMGLGRRLTVYVGFVTFVILCLSTVALIAEVPFVEEKLISESLYYELNAVIPKNGVERPIMPNNPEHRLYTDNPVHQANGAWAIPKRYAALDVGYSEQEGTRSYFVYKLQRDGHNYIIESDQTEFEETESELRRIAIAISSTVFIFVLIATYFITRRLLKPVHKLAQAVRRSATAGSYRPLGVRVTDDEIGYLAATCDKAFYHIYELLARERFFSADLSHELRTHLSVISTSAELMYDNANASQRQSLDRILKACGDTLRLLRVLLALARNDTRDSADELMFTVNEAAERTLEDYETIAAEKGLSLKIVKDEVADAVCEDRFNGSLLLTVMTNLVRNAVSYTKRGGVTIVLMADGFAVKDTGPGIPEKELRAIFEPFYRGSNAVGVHGSGVGLSLANRICQEKRWKLGATSALGQGSTFTLTFH